MSTQRRVAPALAMVAAITGAVALAILFPLNASGSWSVQPDEWETAREQLIEGQFGKPTGVVPASITLLERTPDGDFFYAAETTVGELQTGIVDIDGGGVMCTGAETRTQPDTDILCGVWAGGHAWHYALWVQRSPSTEGGYRHKLSYFATEAEFEAYWEAATLREAADTDDIEAPEPTE